MPLNFRSSTKDCKKDLKVKAKAPMIEFLRTVKTTLSELERIPGMLSLMLFYPLCLGASDIHFLSRERESTLRAVAHARYVTCFNKFDAAFGNNFCLVLSFSPIDVLERWKIAGLNRKLQIKPKEWQTFTSANGETKESCTLVQLILKWVRVSTAV